MGNFFQQISTILLEPPGNLVYHLVLAFSIAGAFVGALNVWRTGSSAEGKRMVTGLGLMLFLRLALFVLAGLAWQGLLNQRVLVPVLDRSVNLLCLLIIAWMWVFPHSSRSGDAATLLIALIVITFSTLSLVWWSAQDTGLSYNGSWPDLAAAMLSVAISTAAGLLLILRRPPGWGYGLGMMGILLVGDVAYLTIPYPEGDFSGTIRLARLIAYPLLLLLPARFPITATEAEPAESETMANAGAQAEGKIPQKESWYPALFTLGISTDPANICQAITKAISHEWTADLCLMVSPPGLHGNMKIVCGYDLIREQNLNGVSINSQAIPVIASAMRRGRSLRLPANSTSPDLVGLEQVLDIRPIGHLLAAPINDPDGNHLAGIILLTPYTKRSWSADDQLRLTEYATPLAQLLQHAYRLTTIRSDFEEIRAELTAIQKELEKVQQENVLLITKLGSDPGNEGNQRLQTVGLTALLAAQNEAQETIAKLRAENAELQKDQLEQIERDMNAAGPMYVASSQDTSERAYAEGELRLALEEVARLRVALSEADEKMLELHKELSSASPASARVREVVALAQELRQPMTSIVGYTDFLLGESIGILGTLQRRFLERIRTSADRMRRLVDNLLIVAGGEYSAPEGAIEKFDLSSVIDDAVTRTGSELRDRSIALRMDLPKHMPDLKTDRHALEKLLVVLLENAGLVTPVDGEISLHVHLKNDGDAYEYVLIQVADQGGGISSNDLSMLFTEDQPSGPIVIAGLSEKVAELTVAKDLAESLGGRLWVDSELGYGATFSLLFPVSMANSTHDPHGGYPL